MMKVLNSDDDNGNDVGRAHVCTQQSLASCRQHLYTTRFVTSSAATLLLSGRQGDAFGVVVGKLTKKNRCPGNAVQSEHMDQTHVLDP
jgi:hypothetical protein